MKTIFIRDLHAKTGYWVRRSLEFDEIHVKDRGRVVAKLVPHKESNETPFYSRRTLTPAFKRLASSGTFFRSQYFNIRRYMLKV